MSNNRLDIDSLVWTATAIVANAKKRMRYSVLIGLIVFALMPGNSWDIVNVAGLAAR